MVFWHLANIVCSLVWPFLFCHYATIATERIADIGQFTYASDWFDYPIDIQKSMILIIARSQEPIKFSGLNVFYCNIEVFGKVSIFNLTKISKWQQFFALFTGFESIHFVLFDIPKFY